MQGHASWVQWGLTRKQDWRILWWGQQQELHSLKLQQELGTSRCQVEAHSLFWSEEWWPQWHHRLPQLHRRWYCMPVKTTHENGYHGQQYASVCLWSSKGYWAWIPILHSSCSPSWTPQCLLPVSHWDFDVSYWWDVEWMLSIISVWESLSNFKSQAWHLRAVLKDKAWNNFVAIKVSPNKILWGDTRGPDGAPQKTAACHKYSPTKQIWLKR